MTYDEAISYIHGVSNFFCKPGLDRIKELCSGLGDPQDELRFIHVAGTNGKGSVCSMLNSILCKEGYRVGLFTSPYVRDFTERMRINGQNIPDDRLASLTERVRAIAEKMSDKPTEFELICAIGFEYFREEKCDVVVLEVGMGGRLDATNVIKTPLLSIITGISIDHTAFLGGSIEEIAGEKAGIIKDRSVVVFGGNDLRAEAVIAEECERKQSILYKTDYNKLKIHSMDLCGCDFDYKRKGLHITLLGSYQPRNAAIVLEAIDRLNEAGFFISEEAVRQGLSKATWPARFEIIGRDPIIIFDGAHNPEGVCAAVDSIKEYFIDKRVVVISGILQDKDYRMVAKSISLVAKEVYTITPNSPRALSGDDYAHVIQSYGVSAIPCSSITEAISLAIASATALNTAVCCLGSLYTYAEVMSALENN